MIFKVRNMVNPSASTMNIKKVFRLLLWLNRILGLMVIEMPEGVPWLKLSIFLVFLRFGSYMPLLFNSVSFSPNSPNSITIMAFVHEAIFYVNVIVVLMSSILTFVYYKKPSAFFKRIALADETLEIFGIDPEHKQTCKENVTIVIGWCSACLFILCTEIAVSCYFVSNVLSTVISVVAFQIPLLLNSIVELNFILIISCMGKRFQRLNALIQSTTSTSNAYSTQNINRYENILKRNQNKVAVKPTFYYNNRNNIQLLLKVARQLHLDLCSTCRDINDTFSKQLTMQMASNFLLFTGFSYCLYLFYNEPQLSLTIKLQQYVSFGVWILISIGRILYVVHTSVSVATEAQKTSQIAHEIQVTGSQANLVDEVHQLSLQIMQHPLYFTASGLMVLDYGYVRGFVGSVTTYLMILIQNQPDMLKAASTFVEGHSENETETTTSATSF